MVSGIKMFIRLFYGIVATVIFAIFLLQVAVLFVFVLSTWRGNGISTETLVEYQSLNFDPETGNFFVGTLKYGEFLDSDDFVMNEESGRLTLVSKFGSTEYFCKGTCYCNNGERRNAGVMKNGMVILVAAISSSFAYKLAENRFQERCSSDLASHCQVSSIFSEIEECTPVMSMSREFEVNEGQSKTSELINSEDHKKSSKKYWCSGKCRSVDISKDMLERSNKKKRFGLPGVEVTEESVQKGVDMCNSIEQDSEVEVFNEEDPKEKFMEMLMPTCAQVMRERVIKNLESKGYTQTILDLIQLSIEKVGEKEWSPCKSHIDGINETIKCREMND